jgi:hypothetical protein
LALAERVGPPQCLRGGGDVTRRCERETVARPGRSGFRVGLDQCREPRQRRGALSRFGARLENPHFGGNEAGIGGRGRLEPALRIGRFAKLLAGGTEDDFALPGRKSKRGFRQGRDNLVRTAERERGARFEQHAPRIRRRLQAFELALGAQRIAEPQCRLGEQHSRRVELGLLLQRIHELYDGGAMVAACHRFLRAPHARLGARESVAGRHRGQRDDGEHDAQDGFHGVFPATRVRSATNRSSVARASSQSVAQGVRSTITDETGSPVSEDNA